VERNNHGHAVHVALKAADVYHPLYRNPFDSKDGWLSNLKYKTLAVDHAAQVFQTGGCVIRTPAVIAELSGIQASTLSAFPGQHDDRAMAAIIGLAAIKWGGCPGRAVSYIIPPKDIFADLHF
jgi:hypothetical protein